MSDKLDTNAPPVPERAPVSTAEAVAGYVDRVIEVGAVSEMQRIETWRELQKHAGQTVKTAGTERGHLNTVRRATDEPVGEN